MAKKKFDREVVLDNAIELFWQHGFHASSMQQLTSCTGLKPGSLYLEFENKEGLCKEALKRYAHRSAEHLQGILDSAPSIGEGICEVLERAVEDSESSDYCSCFIIKTQLELAAEAGPLYELASACLKETEKIFQSYLEREYNFAVSRARANSIMLHLFGLRVYGYQHGAAHRMREGLREGLNWLPWE